MIDGLLLLDLTIRVLIAIGLGAAIGLERQWRLRTAGIRTNALVAVGSALFVVVGAVGLGDGPMTDPTRVAAQVVSGIGFLGAGVILRDGLNIRGLTTAATLWCAAAIGSLAGAGMELMALIGAGAIIATNTLLRPFSRFVNRRTGNDRIAAAALEDEPGSSDYIFEVTTTEKNEPRVRALVLQSIDRPELTLRSLDIRQGKSSQMRVVAGVSSEDSATAGLEAALQRMSLDPKVIATRWWPVESED
ncbi:MgtC/SapB family protein [Microbacterium jejuense]|uniref:MgtC/SapB family protein n=1 Tax=Microbacterium jejuense TaxID=1263637 RepID=A0ABS7HKU6_9MICO|nr:MgtC/SapB family protein [Microbacterium jejuense]MBW9093074.1 MgtC/SapB family protein [Microbacterium jejuense]